MKESETMFEVGDYIVYGSNGVCRVENIGTMDITGLSKDRIYYTLVPIYKSGNRLFTPTDNNRVVMRPIISKREALSLIDSMKNMETLTIKEDRQVEIIYKEALRTCDCKQWIKIMKTLYERKQSKIAKGKKVTASDEKYFNLAEENLFGELAIPLEIEKDKVEEFIAARIEEGSV